jgi:hypothetical protein
VPETIPPCVELSEKTGQTLLMLGKSLKAQSPENRSGKKRPVTLLSNILATSRTKTSQKCAFAYPEYSTIKHLTRRRFPPPRKRSNVPKNGIHLLHLCTPQVNRQNAFVTPRLRIDFLESRRTSRHLTSQRIRFVQFYRISPPQNHMACTWLAEAKQYAIR